MLSIYRSLPGSSRTDSITVPPRVSCNSLSASNHLPTSSSPHFFIALRLFASFAVIFIHRREREARKATPSKAGQDQEPSPSSDSTRFWTASRGGLHQCESPNPPSVKGVTHWKIAIKLSSDSPGQVDPSSLPPLSKGDRGGFSPQ